MLAVILETKLATPYSPLELRERVACLDHFVEIAVDLNSC
jgi:hypothetical protein